MSSSVAQFFNREIPKALNWAGRFRLTMGVIVCFAIFRWLSGMAGVPPVEGMAGSLLILPSAISALATTAIAMIVCTLLGKWIVGDLLIGSDLQFEGGLMAALLGMAALVFRVGPVRYALFAMDDPKVFVLLAAELMLLYWLVGFCWLMLRWTTSAPAHGQTEPLAIKLAALATHAVVMMACVVLFAQSGATGQAFAAVGISAMLGSMAAYLAFPSHSTFWHWVSPLLVGLVGYAAAYFNPTGLAIGFPDGLLGPLARATPLAYAAAGPAGAIFGLWIAYGWNQGEEQQQSR